ncbi:transposase [Streptomyces bobili]|uniref:transposase n=1 Tax=Streptomyces bobili TaxID=67280 RepID=UPI0033A8AAA5
MNNYPLQCKADTVAQYQSRPGATIRLVAADLGVNPETSRNWVRTAGASRPRGRRSEVRRSRRRRWRRRTPLCARALTAAERTRGSLAGAVMHTDHGAWLAAGPGFRRPAGHASGAGARAPTPCLRLHARGGTTPWWPTPPAP